MVVTSEALAWAVAPKQSQRTRFTPVNASAYRPSYRHRVSSNPNHTPMTDTAPIRRCIN